METKYVFLTKPMSFYQDWLRELEPFRAKHAGMIVSEGISFGPYAICWLLVSDSATKPVQKKGK